MSLIILNTVNALVQSMLFSLFFVNTVQMKYSRIRTFLILASAIVLTAVITLPVGRFVPVKAAVMLSVTIAAVFRVSDNTRREKIEICGAFLFILIVSELLSLQFYRVLSTDGDIRLYELTDTKIVCGIFFSIIFFSASMIFSVIWNKITDPVKYRMILFLILLPASQVLLLLGIYNPDVQSRMKNILISGTACLISVVSVDYIMYRTVNQSIRLIKNEQELEFLKMQRKLQFSYYQLAAENAQKTSALKHELSNQMQTAFALLEQGGDSRGKATALLEQIRGGIRDIDQIVYCGNPIINTVLAIKTAEAKRAGIQTDIRIGSIESIVIADMDLCSIFSNLYDNAIEACRACPGGDAVITVKAGEKSGYLVIRFTNTWNSDLELHTAAVETSKADKRSHGYGLKLVRTIAQKYNGDVVVNGRNRIFEITVSLKISLKIY